jgi:DNA-binding NtrC family response regulator
MMSRDLSILIVSADASVTQKCSQALGAFGFRRLQIADSMERARLELRLARPAVVLLDESAVKHSGDPQSLESTVRELTEVAPVVVAAPYARLPEMTSLIASGTVDFVARTGDFPHVAARLLGRHLGLHEQKAETPSSSKEKEGDFGELLRHEVNNPLTGILGNTELLLARPEHLPPGAIERLQTIADLAVRLREIVRHLSNTWEANHPAMRPM